MIKPYVVINAKTYPQTTGEGAVALAKICSAVVKEHGANIGLAVQDIDLRDVLNVADGFDVYAEHVDAGSPGKNTGFELAKTIVDIGVKHTLLNHSEHKVPFEQLQETLDECKELGMTVIVCADTIEEIEKVKVLSPAFIAFEPPELIGGGISVSSAQPDMIEKAVQACGSVPLLVGAGVKNSTDVRVALELGAVGVLVASGVDTAQNPKQVLEDLALVKS